MERKIFIGGLIRNKRKELKMTQIELASRLGLSRSYLSDIENGRYNPSVNFLFKIIAILDLDLNEFKMT